MCSMSMCKPFPDTPCLSYMPTLTPQTTPIECLGFVQPSACWKCCSFGCFILDLYRECSVRLERCNFDFRGAWGIREARRKRRRVHQNATECTDFCGDRMLEAALKLGPFESARSTRAFWSSGTWSSPSWWKRKGKKPPGNSGFDIQNRIQNNRLIEDRRGVADVLNTRECIYG